MSDRIFPEQSTDLGEKAQNAQNKANEYLQNPQAALTEAESFYNRNKSTIHAVVAGVVLYKVQKRITTKAVVKALQTQSVRIDLQAYLNDLESYDVAQWARSTKR